jgi:hypothetical protein
MSQLRVVTKEKLKGKTRAQVRARVCASSAGASNFRIAFCLASRGAKQIGNALGLVQNVQPSLMLV